MYTRSCPEAALVTVTSLRPSKLVAPPPALLLIVILSVVASVVIVIPVPAINVNVSVVDSAATDV